MSWAPALASGNLPRARCSSLENSNGLHQKASRPTPITDPVLASTNSSTAISSDLDLAHGEFLIASKATTRPTGGVAGDLSLPRLQSSRRLAEGGGGDGAPLCAGGAAAAGLRAAAADAGPDRRALPGHLALRRPRRLARLR